MSTNLENLKNDLDQKAQADYTLNRDNLPEAKLTEADKETIDILKQQNPEVLMVNESGTDGQVVSTPVQEFVKSLDDKVKEIDENHIIKTLNSGDIQQSMEEIKAQNKARSMEAYKALATVIDENLTADQIMEINNSALDAIKEKYGLSTLSSDLVSGKIRNLSVKQLAAFLPKPFIDLYLDEKDIVSNNIRGAERLKAVISYLCAVGPDMDYLNQYIEDENRLTLVSKQILQCQLDFNAMLKDKEKLSEIVNRSAMMAPDNSIWSKFIKLPNRVHNEFAQRYVIQEHYRDAYINLLYDYPIVEEDEDTPEEVKHTNQINTRAHEIINEEIKESAYKMEVYNSIMNLDLLKELYTILEERYISHTKLTQKFLVKEAKSAIDRINRCKQNLPFPGWNGMISKADVVYSQYLKAYSGMISQYNMSLLTATDQIMKSDSLADEDKKQIENTNVYPIAVVGHNAADVYNVYSTVLLILMGRIVRKLSNHDCTKYDAIVLDSYFQIFCRLGTDIYVMSDIWYTVHKLVEYILTNVKLDQKWN